MDSSISCNTVSSYFRFTPDQTIDIDQPKLNFYLCGDKSDTKWNLQKNGVFGLAPRSNFYPYLISAYGQSSTIDISVSYIFKKENWGKIKSDDFNFQGSKIILNGSSSKSGSKLTLTWIV